MTLRQSKPDYQEIVLLRFAEGLPFRPIADVLGISQELRGVPALHASVVNVNRGAVAFLTHLAQGKSALAAALVDAGYPLLADDNLHILSEDDRSIIYKDPAGRGNHEPA
jgi:hypothetical protein